MNKKQTNPKDMVAMKMHLEGRSNSQIANALGHKNKDKASASAAVSRRLKRVKDADALVEALEKYGATDKVIIQTVMECLVAKHPVNVIVHGGEMNERELIDAPDYQVRLRAAELLGRWSGWDKSHLNLNLGDGKIDVEIHWPGAKQD